jgi:hypothetical protein
MPTGGADESPGAQRQVPPVLRDQDARAGPARAYPTRTLRASIGGGWLRLRARQRGREEQLQKRRRLPSSNRVLRHFATASEKTETTDSRSIIVAGARSFLKPDPAATSRSVDAHGFKFEYTLNSAKHIPFDGVGP